MRRSWSRLVLVGLVGASVLPAGIGSGVAPAVAAAPPPPGVTVLADDLPTSTSPAFLDTTMDGRWAVAGVDLSDTVRVWGWDLEAGTPVPEALSHAFPNDRYVEDGQVSDDLVLFSTVGGTLPRQVHVVVPGSGTSPVLLRGGDAAEKEVTYWGIADDLAWFVNDADADGPRVLDVRDARAASQLQPSPIRTLSPVAVDASGVRWAAPTPDGTQLVFRSRIDADVDELWVVPITGTAADAVRVAQVDPGQFIGQPHVSADGARVVYVVTEAITDGTRFEVWSAPLDPSSGNPVRLLVREHADGMYLESLGLFDPDVASTSVLASWLPDPLGQPSLVLAPIAGPASAAVEADLSDDTFAFPAIDGPEFSSAWDGEGGIYLNVQTPEEVYLGRWSPGSGEVADVGNAGSSRVSILGDDLVRHQDGLLVAGGLDGGVDRTVLDPDDISASNVQFRATAAGRWLPFIGEDPVYESFGAVSRRGTLVGPFDLEGTDDLFFATFDLQASSSGTHAFLRHDTTSVDTGDAATLLVLPLPPSVPLGVTARAGDGTISVAWDAPDDGTDPTGYEITATPRDGGDPVVVEVGGGATSAAVEVANGSRWDVTVLPYSDAGAGEPASRRGLLPLEAGVGRLFGAGRVETAVAASRATFDPGVPAVYVATAANFPDALAAGPAAARDGGPILLLPSSGIPDVVADELERLEPDRIVVLGGAAVVGNAVAADLAEYTDGPVERLAGDDRYETAAAIAATFDAADRVVVATGANFPDALAGGALAALGGDPILLVTPTRVPGPAEDQLDRLEPDEILLLGGEGAISRDVEGALVVRTDDLRRVFGDNRYATSAAIADEFPTSVDLAYVATGATFPDALAGTPVAAVTGSPVVLVRKDEVPEEAATAIGRLTLRRIVVLGGVGAVADAVVDALGPLLVD